MLRSLPLLFSSRWNNSSLFCLHVRSNVFSWQQKTVIGLQHGFLPKQISQFSTAKVPVKTRTAAQDAKRGGGKNDRKKRGWTKGKHAAKKGKGVQGPVTPKLKEKEKPSPLQQVHSPTTDRHESVAPTRTRLFVDELQKLDLALKEKNYLAFEQTMKEMQTKIRSSSSVGGEVVLSIEEMGSITTKLRAWNEMAVVSSESIASVLTSAGYLGLSLSSMDQNREVIEGIIEKYMREENKSTHSMASFFSALNKVGMKWTEIKQERKDQILVLVNNLIQADDLDVRSYLAPLMGLAVEWTILPEDAKLAILEGIENRSPTPFQAGELSNFFYG
jgi:hypothetical protein